MYEFNTQVRVRYAEADPMNVVYYGNYAQYFEVGRVESLRNLGISYKGIEDMGIMLPVVELNIKYLRPAKYDDLLTIKSQIKELPTEGFEFQIEFFMPKNFSAQDATGFTKEMGEISRTLNMLVKPLIHLGYNIETQITLFDRLYEAIIERAAACKADYVFKPLRHHGAVSRSLFTPTDWNLVRMCPCPTLFISQPFLFPDFFSPNNLISQRSFLPTLFFS